MATCAVVCNCAINYTVCLITIMIDLTCLIYSFIIYFVSCLCFLDEPDSAATASSSPSTPTEYKQSSQASASSQPVDADRRSKEKGISLWMCSLKVACITVRIIYFCTKLFKGSECSVKSLT